VTTRKQLVWLLALTVGGLASAIGVVYTKHASRDLFKEQEALRQEIGRQRTTWRQLQLEQSTMAAHSRIERIAREKLKMRMLDPKEVLVFRQ
jgi:cell division protein FtsL